MGLEKILNISSLYCNDYWHQLKSPSPKDALCQRSLNFVNVFSLFRYYLPLEKGMALHLFKLESIHPRMLCAKFGRNWPSGSGEEDFLILSMYFRFFVIISPWKRAGPFN